MPSYIKVAGTNDYYCHCIAGVPRFTEKRSRAFSADLDTLLTVLRHLQLLCPERQLVIVTLTLKGTPK